MSGSLAVQVLAQTVTMQYSLLSDHSCVLHRPTITITRTETCCAPYKQNDGALHCHDVLTIKAVLN